MVTKSGGTKVHQITPGFISQLQVLARCASKQDVKEYFQDVTSKLHHGRILWVQNVGEKIVNNRNTVEQVVDSGREKVTVASKNKA